ncbi:hypothetical protein ACFQZC_15060 [Streptacidiphilus monticola]
MKSCWALLWLVYLAYPVQDLVHGKHGTAATAVGWGLLAAFLVVYFDLLFRRQMTGRTVEWNPGTEPSSASWWPSPPAPPWSSVSRGPPCSPTRPCAPVRSSPPGWRCAESPRSPA